MSIDVLDRLIAALGMRVVRVSNLGQPGIGLRKHGLLLLDADLTEADREKVLDWALQQFATEEVAR